MAQNPGNKIHKDSASISSDDQRILDAIKKAGSGESEAIRAFKDARQQELRALINEANERQRFIEYLTERIEEVSSLGGNTEDMEAQLHKQQQEIKVLQARRASINQRLKDAGAEEVAAAAESQAIEDEMIAEIQRRAQKVNELNQALRNAKKAGKSPEDIAAIEKQLASAKKAANDPELINKSNYTSSPASKAGWLESLPGGFSKYNGTMNEVMDALSGKSKVAIDGEGFWKGIHPAIDKFISKGPIDKLLNITGKILDVASAIRKPINEFVDEAANVLAANVGRINAALEGTGRTYADATESMVESLGMNRFVKQTDYIEKIANLTAAGITYNVEQRAILETIKDKTIASFSSMEGSLLRLVRLKQTDITANQFGMEAALRNTLNRVFKDSTYMKDMFDGISGAITDAVMISGGKDVTEYSSVVQTWMGAMYESGIDSNMVTKMANAINALGSGNVSALASDQDMQRLILLSMDTIGMDYADILQQGLAPSDINDLLTAVVKYLSKIETNTKDNNVLQASYTNLFGMSMADLQGFRNLKSKMGGLTSVNAGSAMAVTNAEVAALESTQRTIVAEQVNNALANARFTFGNEIAKNGDSYLEWKLSNMTLDVAEQYLRSPGKKNKIAKKLSQGAARIAQGLIFKNEMKGVLSMIEALPSLFNDESTGISFLLNGSGSSYSGEDNGSNGSGIGATLTNAASGAFKAIGSLWTKISSHNVFQTAYQSYSSKDWEDEGDEQEEILAALESAMVVHNAEESKKAFATYLVGMTDDTLRSFASIFADEDAMADTFEGNNNVLKDNLFKYAEDTTSNSSEGNTGDADAGGADELD